MLTPITVGNEAFNAGKYADAIQNYAEALICFPDMGNSIAYNIVSARAKYRDSRTGVERPSVGVCGWELAHNSAGRVFTLANVYKLFADVEIIGCLFPNFGRNIWEPLRATPISLHTILVEDGDLFVAEALRLVAAHPYDIVHLSKPRGPNILFALFYKILWDATVIMDIDDEELGFQEANTPLELETYLREHGDLPDWKAITGRLWTRLAVGLVGLFDGITVSNPALQRRYGGKVIRHAREGILFQNSEAHRAKARQKYGISAEKKVVLFLGTPRKHKGILITAQAIAKLKRSDVVYVVVGDFPEKEKELKSQLEALDGCTTVFLGNRPFSTISQVLALADCCCFLLDPSSEVARFQIPAKLSDSLAMGIPTICSQSEAIEDLEHRDCILLTDYSVDSLRETLRRLFEDKYLSESLSRNAKASFREEFSAQAVEEHLKKVALPLRESSNSFFTETLKNKLQTFQKNVKISPYYRSFFAILELIPQKSQKKLLSDACSEFTDENRSLQQKSQKKSDNNKKKNKLTETSGNPEFDQVKQLVAQAMAIDDWSGAYKLWKSLLEGSNIVLSIEQIVRISKELFVLDAFPEAATALKRAEKLNAKSKAVTLEKARQYYYHCYSSWLMLVTENEPDWYKADGLEIRPDWTTACALIEKAEKVMPRNNLRRYVQAYLLLAEEAWDKNKRDEAHAALRVALGAIGPNRIEKALADEIFRAVDQVRDGTGNPEDFYHQSLQDALAALPLELLPVQDWLCLNDILNWNGLMLCGYVAREKAVDLAIAQGKATRADKETLKTALKAALDRSETALADEFLGRLQKISPEALDVRELDSCCELMKGNLEAFRAKWPHPPSPAEQKLREYLKGKSVAIVGPAPTGSLDGGEIDRHDVVVRINWRGVERQGDPKEFGSRTDISLYNAHSARFFEETKFKALGKQLNFFLLRRSIFTASELKSKGLVLQKISEFPATFYKSLNSLQATQFYFLLLCDGSQKYFKIDFYTGEQFHHKKYREKEGGKKERIINTIRTVLSNHDFPSQITIFRGITKISVKKHHFFPHTHGILKKISSKWIFINYTSSALFLEKPKRQLLKGVPFKSRSMNGDHLWYDNYATTFLKNYPAACFPKKLDGKRILVIAHNFSLTTGASRSISHFLNALVVSKTDCSLESIEFNDGEDISKHSYILDDNDIVIINSLGVFKQNVKLVDLLENNKSANLFFYLHETEWTFKKFEEYNPELFSKVINLIRRNIALCVSNKQIEYLNTTHSISNTRLVGETSVLPLDPWNFHFKCPRDNGVSKIVMVGTIQPRKGVDLFSRIADLAVSKKLNFRFIWVGKKIDHNVYLSKNVDWLGNKNSVEIQEILTNADLFFLSSIDDPMPLSVLEALQIRKKCVAYKETGAAELILEESSKIGEIFNEYSPESALEAIHKVLEKNTRFEDFDSILEKHSLQNFSQKFTSALLSHKIRDDNLNINNIRNKLQKQVLLLCNGPSYSSASFDHINLEDSIIVRVNHFYLESKPFANGHIDFLFWSLGNATMHDNIIKNLKNGRYKINQFMCPVPYNALESNDLAFQNHMPEDSYFDHWALIAQNPRLARCMMSRPLPTTGLQALGCLMVLGFNDFLIAGMDFYSDPKKRYHYEIPNDFVSKLDAKHLKPGYEKGAHSRETDSKFLKIILQEYPHCKIATTGSMPVLESILNER